MKAYDLYKTEIFYPLKVKVSSACWLAQTDDYADADKLFTVEYAYFSSTSSSWLEHARRYSDQIINTLRLNHDNFVVEIASNDGYLLKNFMEVGIKCLGIEQTASAVKVAEKFGITVRKEFFSDQTFMKLKVVPGCQL